MTELDRELIRRRLKRIVRNLQDLAQVEDLSLDAYRSDRFRLKGTERLLQETVEAAVSVNLHLLRAEGYDAPGDAYRSFVEIGRAGLLSASLAESLAPSTGLRNRLVHEYDELEDEIVLESVGEARRLFATYVREIEALLDR